MKLQESTSFRESTSPCIPLRRQVCGPEHHVENHMELHIWALPRLQLEARRPTAVATGPLHSTGLLPGEEEEEEEEELIRIQWIL